MMEELFEYLKTIRAERQWRMFDIITCSGCFGKKEYEPLFWFRRDPEARRRKQQQKLEELIALVERLEAEAAAEQARAESQTEEPRKGWWQKVAEKFRKKE